MKDKQLIQALRHAVSWAQQAQPPEPLRGLVTGAKQTIKSLLADIDNRAEFEDAYEHERMLADTIRVDTYHTAIHKHVKPGDVVVDLGTGTGILAFFAARAGAKRVYAIDHGDTIEVAEAVAAANGIHTVEFVRANSRDFQPPEKVDVIVHEQIGDELFDENMIENVTDLRDRILRPGGKVLPARFKLFMEPIELRKEHAVPAVWQQELHGIRFDCLKGRPLGPWRNVNPNAAGHSRWIHPLEVSQMLSEPQAVLEVDLETVERSAAPKNLRFARTIQRVGRFDGLCIYFGVAFDDQLGFDTSPLSRKTHWGCLLLSFPLRTCQVGDVMTFDIGIGDIREVSTWDIRVTHGS